MPYTDPMAVPCALEFAMVNTACLPVTELTAIVRPAQHPFSLSNTEPNRTAKLRESEHLKANSSLVLLVPRSMLSRDTESSKPKQRPRLPTQYSRQHTLDALHHCSRHQSQQHHYTPIQSAQMQSSWRSNAYTPARPPRTKPPPPPLPPR